MRRYSFMNQLAVNSLAINVFNTIQRDNGCSLNIAGRRPQAGYMVGFHGCMNKPVNELTQGDILTVCKSNAGILQTGVYLGAWVNDGEVYIDLSANILDLNEAIEAGRKYNQQAIWDVKEGKTIKIR